VSEWLLVIYCIGHLRNFTAIPKYYIPFKTWHIRGRTVTISLFYMLESFSSYFSCLEKNLNCMLYAPSLQTVKTILIVLSLNHKWTGIKKKWLTLYREYNGRVGLHGKFDKCSNILLNMCVGERPHSRFSPSAHAVRGIPPKLHQSDNTDSSSSSRD
jgi:hypothetical protein